VERGILSFAPSKQRANGWRLQTNGGSLSELRHAAFAYWEPKLLSPTADRHEILRHLRAAAPDGHPVVRALELTVAPRTSRPGTPEALIDDLTEYRSWLLGHEAPEGPHPGEAAYWKLVDLGFDAVPALLDHVDDPRFTRHTYQVAALASGFAPIYAQRTVGQVVQEVLSGLGCGDNPREWWETARRLGEEEWLTRSARPPVPREGEADSTRTEGWPPHPNVLRLLGRKYPIRLGEVYRHVLITRPGLTTWDLADAVGASGLPAAAKVRLLGEGATHRRLVHRLRALDALIAVDPAAFRRHLVATLGELPPDVSDLEHTSHPEANLVLLFQRTPDPACWDALAAAARRAGVPTVFSVLWEFDSYRLVGNGRPPEAVQRATRRERLRFLIGFLDDDSPYPIGNYQVENLLALALEKTGDTAYPTRGYTGTLAYWFLEVRDYAAVVLSEELGWGIGVKAGRGDEARRVIREAVREAAGREIAAPR
jgi:hypothetical protein